MRLESVTDRLDATCRVGAPDLDGSCLRVVAGGGKRLRPALTLTIADVGGVFDRRAISAAVAVELVQIGSLVHDDIFDNAETRRGMPTINARGRSERSASSGDLPDGTSGRRSRGAGNKLHQTSPDSVALLCVGQTTETQHLFDIGQEIDRYLFTIGAKTAALFSCSCRVGALCAGCRTNMSTAFGEFGRTFGMAFQLIDDVLDLIGDPERLGKPVGADMRSGVLTMPAC